MENTLTPTSRSSIPTAIAINIFLRPARIGLVGGVGGVGGVGNADGTGNTGGACCGSEDAA